MSKAERTLDISWGFLGLLFLYKTYFLAHSIGKVSNKWGMHVTIPVWTSELWNTSILYSAYCWDVMTLSRSVSPNSLDSRFLCCCSVAKSCTSLCDHVNCSTPGFPVLPHLPEFAQIRVHWVGDAIQPSHPVTPFSSYPQSFPASGSFPMSQLFTSGGQNIIKASASVLPMNIQGWFPLGLIGLMSLLSKGLTRVFSGTTVWKHRFKWPHSILQIH